MGTPSEDKFVPSLTSQNYYLGESSEIENFYEEFLIPEDNLYISCDASTDSELLSFRDVQKSTKSNLFYSFYAEQEEREEEEEEMEEEEEIYFSQTGSLSAIKKKSLSSSKQEFSEQEFRRRSLFVHSSPIHFPDINKARKSVFGSIFLRTTADVAEETALLKTVVESSYTMLQALLNSFEKILSAPSSDKEKRKNTLLFRNSIQQALEAHGICKTYADGSVYWNIYPITRNYLFTVQIGDNFHHTRLLSKIEERILAGSLVNLELPYFWPTGSAWCGHWDALGMASNGTYKMPHGVSYVGKMQNGLFHDNNATLTYPNRLKVVHCVFEKGKLLDFEIQFPDKLMYEKQNWQYCKFPDRRFWSEVQNGLKAAKIAHKTLVHTLRKIPPKAYDAGVGLYYPDSLMLVNSCGNLLRVPLSEEDAWIRKHCRKGVIESADFRPDLFENWFDNDEKLIQSILNMQENFRNGKITYDELQQFYADLGLLPTCSNYKKRKSPSEVAMEEFMKSVPSPKPLEKPKRIKKYKGHKLPVDTITACNQETWESNSEQSFKVSDAEKFSKSLLKNSKDSKLKYENSQTEINNKTSRISFNIVPNLSESSALNDVELVPEKRKIPPKYLAYQPFMTLPFETKNDLIDQYINKCQTLHTNSVKSLSEKSLKSLDSSILAPEDSYDLSFFRKKNLEKFMKSIILQMVTNILIKERERHRKRLTWACEFPKKDTGLLQGDSKMCFKILEELFESIPENEEYCDSYPHKTCDLKKLAEDKHNELKFWGRRIFYLDFHEEIEDEQISSKTSSTDCESEY